MELRGEHPALDRAERPIERLLDGSHGDLFEHDPGCVLGSVDVTHLWISRHDHRGRPIPAGEPRPLGDDDRTVPEIELAGERERVLLDHHRDRVRQLVAHPLQRGLPDQLGDQGLLRLVGQLAVRVQGRGLRHPADEQAREGLDLEAVHGRDGDDVGPARVVGVGAGSGAASASHETSGVAS